MSVKLTHNLNAVPMGASTSSARTGEETREWERRRTIGEGDARTGEEAHDREGIGRSGKETCKHRMRPFARILSKGKFQ